MSDSKNKYDNYKFYICTAQTTPFVNTIESIANQFPEGIFEFSKDGIRYRNMTKNRDVYMDCIMKHHNFEQYYCPKTEKVPLCIGNFFKSIKSIDNCETLKLYIEKDNPSKFIIDIFNKDDNTNYKTELNMIDLSMPKLEIPDTEFNNVIVIPSPKFKKVCGLIGQFNEKVEIILCGGQIQFKGTNSDVSQTFIIRPTENGAKFKKTEKVIHGCFVLKYLQQFCKCNALSRNIDMLFVNDFPLILMCQIPNLGETKLLIAPQPDDDDGEEEE